MIETTKERDLAPFYAIAQKITALIGVEEIIQLTLRNGEEELAQQHKQFKELEIQRINEMLQEAGVGIYLKGL